MSQGYNGKKFLSSINHPLSMVRLVNASIINYFKKKSRATCVITRLTRDLINFALIIPNLCDQKFERRALNQLFSFIIITSYLSGINFQGRVLSFPFLLSSANPKVQLLKESKENTSTISHCSQSRMETHLSSHKIWLVRKPGLCDTARL
jgi:hypothetical protein